MFRFIALALVAAGVAGGIPADAQLLTREEQTVQSASAVLNEIMAVPLTRIPQFMLADAKGVAIVPNVLKGGFVVGVRHGRGLVVVRDEQGGWQPPQFVSLTGGSLGWQAGVQATDVILVFKTEKSVQGLLRGKFTLGVDAAAAAGPVGREASAATDASLKAEIYSYSRSRGLFAGVSLDGSALQIDAEANQAVLPRAPSRPARLPCRRSRLRRSSSSARWPSTRPRYGPRRSSRDPSPGRSFTRLSRRRRPPTRRRSSRNWPKPRGSFRRSWMSRGSVIWRCRPRSIRP